MREADESGWLQIGEKSGYGLQAMMHPLELLLTYNYGCAFMEKPPMFIVPELNSLITSSTQIKHSIPRSKGLTMPQYS